jgi:hypothetical protein
MNICRGTTTMPTKRMPNLKNSNNPKGGKQEQSKKF